MNSSISLFNEKLDKKEATASNFFLVIEKNDSCTNGEFSECRVGSYVDKDFRLTEELLLEHIPEHFLDSIRTDLSDDNSIIMYASENGISSTYSFALSINFIIEGDFLWKSKID